MVPRQRSTHPEVLAIVEEDLLSPECTSGRYSRCVLLWQECRVS
jgi:hypothetical protein